MSVPRPASESQSLAVKRQHLEQAEDLAIEAAWFPVDAKQALRECHARHLDVWRIDAKQAADLPALVEAHTKLSKAVYDAVLEQIHKANALVMTASPIIDIVTHALKATHPTVIHTTDGRTCACYCVAAVQQLCDFVVFLEELLLSDKLPPRNCYGRRVTWDWDPTLEGEASIVHPGLPFKDFVTRLNERQFLNGDTLEAHITNEVVCALEKLEARDDSKSRNDKDCKVPYREIEKKLLKIMDRTPCHHEWQKLKKRFRNAGGTIRNDGNPTRPNYDAEDLERFYEWVSDNAAT